VGWRDWIGGAWLPQRCLACGESTQRGSLCVDCLVALPLNRCACPRCALPLPQSAPLCGSCIRKAPPQSRTLAPLLYAEPVDQLLTGFKFSQRLAAGQAFSDLLAQSARAQGLLDDVSLAIPIPLHRDRLRERGYNQSLELLRPLLRASKLRMQHRALSRQRSTQPQTGLDAIERRKNLRHAFVARRDLVDGQRILLLDDVITTGATVAEAARTLLAAGALEVRVLAVARVAG
jgi:ComF family protein